MLKREQSDCWETPLKLFRELNEEFNFDIDLCAIPSNTRCTRYCTDYLIEDIKEVKCAFMNPPYSNPRPFIEKAWEDSKHCKIVCLVKADPSTKWWATFWDYTGPCSYCDHTFTYEDAQPGDNAYCDLCHGSHMYTGPKQGCKVRFFPKRIKFVPPDSLGNTKASGPTFPSALVIMDRRSL